tara:strand:- start:676 stop:867 length:192 start_codon:yes stop_codon:yes gene_type:complete
MEKEDIQLLTKKGYWPCCRPINGKWEMIMYKKTKTGWVKNKTRVFNYPVSAYNWALNYLEERI